MKENYVFELEFQVRDYECDLQGIVNNAVYQNYMEHTRHLFIKTAGLDFAQLHEKKIDTVVAKIEISYKRPLRSNDKFVCRLAVKKEGIRYIFFQDIYKLPNNELCTRAKIDVVCVVDGKLAESDEINNAFAVFLSDSTKY
jgi:acyl-CoA thioester hydrolase